MSILKLQKNGLFFRYVFSLAFVCVAAILLCQCNFPSPTAPNAWQEYRNEQSGFGVMVPKAWEIAAPSTPGQSATVSIMNYNTSNIIQTSVPDKEWPDGALKIDIVVVKDIKAGTAFTDVIKDHFLSEPYLLSNITENTKIGNTPASSILFVNSGNPNDTVKALGAWQSANQAVVIFVYPEKAWDSQEFKEILKTMTLADKAPLSSPAVAPFAAVDIQTFNKIQNEKMASMSNSITRDTGDEVGDSPIPLYMPFTEGTTWTVGGVGSYYGQGAHTNGNNDYYAVDWNKGWDDLGEAIYPVADGKVVDVRYSVKNEFGGYGNYVKVEHAQGVTTLYAHLSAVNVSMNQQVNIFTRLGSLGSTGNSTGPHLHMSFRVGGMSRYATNPSRRPSPILTTNGWWKLSNGGSGTVSKGNPPVITPTPTKTSTMTRTPTPTPTPTAQGTSCAACIFQNRPDILPFYKANGWNTDQWNWNNILADWCRIDPTGCANEKARCGSCGGTTTSLSACIIGNRPDILPFYKANGWNTDRSNWDNIIANWCSIDPSGCANERARCGY